MRTKVNRLLILLIAGMAILFMFLMLKNTVDHRIQIEDSIAESNKAGQILLCTTSIPTEIKTAAEVNKCYPNNSQVEYFKALEIPPSKLPVGTEK